MTRRLLAVATLLLTLPLAAMTPTIVREGSSLRLSGSENISVIRLTIAGQEIRFRQMLPPDSMISLPVRDEAGAILPDGLYKFEIRLVSATPKKQSIPVSLSGSYQIQGGTVVLDVPEAKPEVSPAKSGVGPDDVVTGPLIVQGRACIGGSCEAAQAFADEDLLVTSTYPYIRLEDTSDNTSAHYDWELITGDKIGSTERFSIKNLTQVRTPFTIEGDAYTDSLYVEDSGNIGIGTSVPETSRHIADESPFITFEGTLIDQTWQMGGGNAFVLYDKTNSSALRLVVEAGASPNSLYIRSNGDVGLGTAFATEKLHVFENVNANSLIVMENLNTGASAAGVLRAKSNAASVNFQAHGSGRSISRFGVSLGSWSEFLSVQGNGLAIGTFNSAPLILGTNSLARINILADGKVGIGQPLPIHPLQMASGAHVTAGGVWTNASSRSLKEDITPLSTEDAVRTLDGLQPVTYRYTSEPGESYVGFIAEDVPELVAMGDHASLSPMDVVAVLTSVVKQQRNENAEQRERLEALAAKYDDAMRTASEQQETMAQIMAELKALRRDMGTQR